MVVVVVVVVADLYKRHQKRILPGFDDVTELEQEIDILTRDITKVATSS
jgi:hypothetical protein